MPIEQYRIYDHGTHVRMDETGQGFLPRYSAIRVLIPHMTWGTPQQDPKIDGMCLPTLYRSLDEVVSTCDTLNMDWYATIPEHGLYNPVILREALPTAPPQPKVDKRFPCYKCKVSIEVTLPVYDGEVLIGCPVCQQRHLIRANWPNGHEVSVET